MQRIMLFLGLSVVASLAVGCSGSTCSQSSPPPAQPESASQPEEVKSDWLAPGRAIATH